jgi:hypothetical protein
MDVYASFCTEVCGKDAEAELLKQFVRRIPIYGFEVLDSSLYLRSYVAVFELFNGSQQFIHGSFSCNYLVRKIWWRM